MDEQELTALIERYSGTVFRAAFCYVKNRAEADDIMQDTFLAFLCEVRGGKRFSDGDHIRAWLIRTAVNRAKNVMRAGRTRLCVPLEQAQDVAAGEPKGADGTLPLLMQLDEKYRLALYMFYYEELSVREIAAALGQTTTAVTTRLSRGRKKLAELLTEEGHDGY